MARDRITPVKAVGGTNNEVLNNLVTHVPQLTKQLTRQQGTANAIQTSSWELCELCGGQYSSTNCQSGQQTVEHAQYVSRFNQNQPQQQSLSHPDSRSHLNGGSEPGPRCETIYWDSLICSLSELNLSYGYTNNFCNNKKSFTYTKELPPEWCPSKSIHIY